MSETMNIRNEPVKPSCAELEAARFLNPSGVMPLQTFPIRPAEFVHIASCRFGTARPCKRLLINWSGDYYRYDIYHDGTSQRYGLRWQNGAGSGWLIAADLECDSECNLLGVIADMSNESVRWDCAHMLWQTAHHTAAAAAAAERQRMLEAHRDGRIRRRRRHGDSIWYIVEQLPDGGTKETYL